MSRSGRRRDRPSTPSPDADVPEAPSSRASGGRTYPWQETYYLLTPAFALADLIAGANVRLAAFDDSPALRGVYYAACMGCALVIHLRPRWAAGLALAESTINVAALILSMVLAYVGSMAAVVEAGGAAPPLDLELVANFLIAGGAGAVAFYQSLHRVERTLGVAARPEQRRPPR